MDSQNGLLMAVKQVDLEMGATGSEEKKQSMVSAMQQEIALLKNLQHENIVQYLGKTAFLLASLPQS
jgi:mitogen-activated protein kinase kinase kinase